VVSGTVEDDDTTGGLIGTPAGDTEVEPGEEEEEKDVGEDGGDLDVDAYGVEIDEVDGAASIVVSSSRSIIAKQ
jgi:hypothetical protein